MAERANTGPSFLYGPQIQYLSQLMEDLAQGDLQVPRFQREFVWTDDKRLELFRSIRDGIPIGSILVWRTSGLHAGGSHAELARVETFDYIGPHLVKKTESQIRSYVLDGHQRLATLLGALRAPEEGRTRDDGRNWSVLYRLDGDTPDFVIAGKRELGPEYLPLTIIFDSIKMLRFMRRLPQFDTAAHELMIQRAEDLVAAFQNYKPVIIPIVTNDPKMVTRSFVRINSQGSKMTEVDMVNALIWSTQFDMAARLHDLRESTLAPLGWGELDDKEVLNTCKAALDFSLYGEDASEIGQALLDKPGVLQDSIERLARAAEFLNKECGIPSPELVPYNFHPVLIAEAFRIKPDPDEEVLRQLKRWIWLTTYEGRFAGINFKIWRIVLDDIRAIANGQTLESRGPLLSGLEPLPASVSIKNTRTRAVALHLMRMKPQDSDGMPLPVVHRFEAELAEGFVLAPVITPAMLKKSNGSSPWFNSPANRIIARTSDVRDVRAKLLRSPGGDEFFASHLINARAAAALYTNRVEEFLEARAEDILSVEREFLKDLALLTSG